MVVEKKPLLIDGSVSAVLFRMTVPMIFGIISMVVFNLADAFFVAKLGTISLAALSFTFPVVLVIASVAIGLGIGASSLISRGIGEGNHLKVQRLTTDSLVLAVIVVAFFCILGLLTIDPLFRLLGATSETLPLIKKYMKIWYFGMVFVVVPMVGNNAIRATGDTKTPAIIMMAAALLNIILDPLLIFGIGPFPRLEIAGAAIATVIARATIMCVSIFVLWHRYNMITLERASLRDIVHSWKMILYIGLPTAGSRLAIPLAAGVITRLVASYGAESVAALGVAVRIDFFAMTVLRALSSVLGPFVGQNWGAEMYDRVRKGIKYSKQFSMVCGFLTFVLLAVLAKPIASIFTDNSKVVSTIILYLRIAPIGYGMQGVILMVISTLIVLQKPIHASMLTVVHLALFFIPMSFLGSYLFGLTGLFAALPLSYFMSGMISHIMLGRILEKEVKIKYDTSEKETKLYSQIKFLKVNS